MKTCTKCGRLKKKFPRNRGLKRGYSCWCSGCVAESKRRTYLKYRERYCLYSKNWSLEHPDLAKEYHKKYWLKNKKKLRAYKKLWRIRNRKRILEKSRRYYVDNKSRVRAKNDEWRMKNPRRYYEMERGYRLRKAHGITLWQYRSLLREQRKVCLICGTGKPGGIGSFQVDHNHKNRRIRGLLCNLCNRGIGYFQDDPKRCEKAATYLEESEDKVGLVAVRGPKGEHEFYKNDGVRRSRLKYAYGITLEQYSLILQGQNGSCKICGQNKPDKMGRWKLDHSHVSGKIRGILCCGCNAGIGNFKDDPSLLRKAAAYLRDEGDHSPMLREINRNRGSKMEESA